MYAETIRSMNLPSRLTLAQLASALVNHGVSSNDPDLATLARKVRKGTISTTAVLSFLGY